MKLATEVNLTFNSKFYKQIDGYTMGTPLSVKLSDKYMVKMETNVVCPLKPVLKYMWTIFITDIGKMNLMKFCMHSITIMKISN